MSNSLDSLSPKELGLRLRISREAVGLTQAEAADRLFISRTTLVAIEQGKRTVKDSELIRLCDAYGVSLNTLLRKEAVHVDLLPRFRKMPEQESSGIAEAVAILNDLVSAEVELEQLLGIERVSRLPPERSLLPGDVRKQAEEDAQDLRKFLGLGKSPIIDLFALLDLELGVRVYFHPLSQKVSGLFAYDESLGACILINSNHRWERQVQTGAHELGHVVSARQDIDINQEGPHENSRKERYANAFAPAFLMPTRTVMQKFNEICAGSKRLTRRHVIVLAHYFGVSREGLVRRLEELGLAPEGTWDWFEKNGGITDKQTADVLGFVRGDLASFAYKSKGSLRLEMLAAQALDRELLSEGQVASLLGIDRLEVRELCDYLEDGHNGTHQLSF